MLRFAPLLLLIAAPAAAQSGFQDTALLDTAVAQFTGKAIGEEGGAQAAVDRRLKLARCALPQLDWRSPAHDAVVIRCMTPAWRIYVPIRSARPEPRAVIASAAVPRPAPSKPLPVIKRGDPVTVEAGGPGFSITRDGTAMGDAAAGARLLVRVEQGKPPIQAVAIEPGRVMLPGSAD